MVARDTGSQLKRGRDSFGRRAWGDAYAELSAADREHPLEADDLERLATAAYLIGEDQASAEIWERAHNELAAIQNPTRAARCAFWLALALLHKGEMARGSGWLARAARLLEDAPEDCVERGYLLVPQALQMMAQGDWAAAHDTFEEAEQVGLRFNDPDLVALARLGQGRTLIRLGRVAEGISILDEDMLAVEAGELSPILTGIIYCAVIQECQAIFDVRRAREWTGALSRWCEDQPDLVPYRGQCRVHRAEIFQLTGDWRDAQVEAERARDQLAKAPDRPAIGMALYQLAELHRLRGELDEAEVAYREAHGWGHSPQPGLARLRLVQGQIDVAQAAIRGAVSEAQTEVARSKLLPAQVEIMIAADQVDAARAAASELAGIAARFDSLFLRALAGHATGSVLLAAGKPDAALESLREAMRSWLELEAPYEAARTRVLLGRACHDLGDREAAEMELQAAREVFMQLEAKPDVARLDSLDRDAPAEESHGLTARELQVLRLLASGTTNKTIATTLVISERTVDRHVSNIFTKLDVSSRAAATAFAYKHGVV